MLLDYLLQTYVPGEPIFSLEIKLDDMTSTNIRQSFKVLTDSGKLRRYDTGIYYIPEQSRLKGGAMLSTERVIERKYLAKGGEIFGYYSGHTFANMLGISTQVPSIREVVSNYASANRRDVVLGGRKLILSKPKTKIVQDNAVILQLLDLLKDTDEYADIGRAELTKQLQAYIEKQMISQSQLDEYLPLYPDKVYRSIYEMRLYSVFA